MPTQTPFSISTDLTRIMRDMIRKGVVAQIQGYKVRVQTGDLLTNWIPWCNVRAGNVKISSMPSMGEAVTLFAPHGDLNNAFILGALNTQTNPMPVDCGVDDLVVDIPTSGKLVLRCGSSSIVMTEHNITIKATRIDWDKP